MMREKEELRTRPGLASEIKNSEVDLGMDHEHIRTRREPLSYPPPFPPPSLLPPKKGKTS
jgi:hypothetical protein